MKRKIVLIVLAIFLVTISIGVYGFMRLGGVELLNDIKLIGQLVMDSKGEGNTADGQGSENPAQTSPAPTSEGGLPEPVLPPTNTNDGTAVAPTPSPAATPQVIDENKLAEQVTLGDKAEATKLVMSRLSASDIATLRGYLKDGITAEEKSKAKALVYSKFSAKEIQTLKAMYYKYAK